MTPEDPPRPSKPNLIEVMARALHREAVGRDEGWEHVVAEVRAALKAADDAGFVLVPKEPTSAMVNVAGEPVMAHHVVNGNWTLRDHLDAGGNLQAKWADADDLRLRSISKTATGIFVWRAMLSAAPKVA